MKKPRLFSLIVSSILLAGFFPLSSPVSGSPAEPQYDLLLRNGLVYDGLGGPGFRADVAVANGRIVRLGRGLRGTARRVIEARGLVVTPGFIDMHTHVDEDMTFAERRAAVNYLFQGVTTIVGGQCGSSAWPDFETAEERMKRWTEEGIGPNVALLVGHGSVRRLVMGSENRPPTPEELEKMKALVKAAMEQGASGLSTGLIYVPGTFARTDEVVELVKVVAPYGGIYHSHIRNERDKLLEAVKEAISICEQTGVPTHISHFKVMGQANWGLVRQACALIEEARARGLKVTADQYPFRFTNGYPYISLIPRRIWLGPNPSGLLSQDDLVSILNYLRDAELIRIYEKLTPYAPLSESHRRFLDTLSRQSLVQRVASLVSSRQDPAGPANEHERVLFLARWNNPAEKEAILKAVKENIDNFLGPENILVALCPDKSLEGLSLPQVAVRRGQSLEEAAVDLALMGTLCIPQVIGDADIETIMQRDYVATGSDGGSPPFGIDLTHIRSYSTFLYKIKEFALKRKVISLPQAIRSQTSLAADIMNWPDRGRVKEGCQADLVVLDLKNIRTPSSVSAPHALARGVRYLIVNGRVAIADGRWTGTLAGQVIKLKKAGS